MREFSTPPTVDLAPSEHLGDIVYRNAARHPDAAALARRVAGGWVDVSAAEFAAAVSRLAKGLIAAGIGPGDRVGLLSRTRYEWTLVDFAILVAGAVTVPVYETSSAEQVAWIVGDSGAVALVVESGQHAATYETVRDRLPAVRALWTIDDGDLDRLARAGDDVPDGELERRRAALTGDALASIIYTSGTTGRPKGCELTHRNFLYDATVTSAGLGDVFTAGSSTLLFLPLAHVFARVIQFGALVARVRLGHTPDTRDLLPDLASFRPTFLLSVPRVFEKVHTGAQTKARAGGAVTARLFGRAEAAAVRYSIALDDGPPGPTLRAEHVIFDRLVYAKLRAALGGAARAAISGGAPLGARLAHFFRGIGVPVYEGYGLTETSAGAALNLPGALRIGTVGRPVPGSAVRIADDGEVLVRGDNVFRGYWGNETATKEVLDDGWLHTGDLGSLDDAGFLHITGRKKEILVTAGGKNVAPAVLEDALRACPLVSQTMVVGDQRPYVAALVTLDPEAVAAWQRQRGQPPGADLDRLRDDPELLAEIQAAVDRVNSSVSRAESIRRFRVLQTDFTETSGHVTPTLKLKRAVVARDFADEIDALYR